MKEVRLFGYPEKQVIPKERETATASAIYLGIALTTCGRDIAKM